MSETPGMNLFFETAVAVNIKCCTRLLRQEDQEGQEGRGGRQQQLVRRRTHHHGGEAAGWRLCDPAQRRRDHAGFVQVAAPAQGTKHAYRPNPLFCASVAGSCWKLNTRVPCLPVQNYDKLNVRTGHYTPIPNGCSPLKRDLNDYIRYE